jgi:tRNA (mo5U34)-methyltransferase
VPRVLLQHASEFGLDRETGTGFRLAHDILGSKVERLECSVYNLDPAEIGQFDLVFISDLLVHLRDPQLALERAYSVCKRDGEVLVADVYAPQLDGFGEVPLAQFTAPGETWWLPSAEALKTMMIVAGFDPIHEIWRFPLHAVAADTIHKIVLRGGAPDVPPWVQMARDYHAAGAEVKR